MTTASDCYFDNSDDHPDAIRYVLDRFEDVWKMKIGFTDQLRGPVAANRETGAVWLPENLPFREVHTRLNRAWLYMLGDVEWAPEFAEHNRPIAPVIPILRTPW